MAETSAPEPPPPPPPPERGPAVPDDGEERGSGTSSSSYSPGAAESRSLEAKHGLSISIPAASNLGFSVGTGAFSQLLAGAMAFSPGTLGVASPGFASPVGLALSPGFTGRFAMTHQEALATVTAQAHMKLQAGYLSPSLSVQSPTFPPLSPVPKEQPQLLSSNENKVSSDSAELPVSKTKAQSSRIVIKTHSDDGYNWRKYGQKQLKSNDIFRSYYRCSRPDCSAKRKVVHHQNGNITDVSYKGQHHHGEHKKTNSSVERESQSGEHLKVNEVVNPSSTLNDLGSYITEREHNVSDEMPTQLDHPRDCHGVPSKDAKDLGREPNSKRRLTEGPITRSSPLVKRSKERKTIVHTSYDSGLASDGYRWRKYGQKVVKGNPNPRSYYRCTESGCPGRKHVERASQDEKAFIITYEGNHNHDILPSKIGSEMPTLAAMKPDEQAEMRNLSVQNKLVTNVGLATTAEKASELGGERVLESAKTLLSMGCRLTPADGGGANNYDKAQSHSTVPVHNS